MTNPTPQPPAPTPNVSETPRTDAAIVESILCTEGGDEECTVYPCVEHVESDFARQLERELTAVTKEWDEAKKIILPAQTTGDGTNRGSLSVFARGWNGYHHELLKTNPSLVNAKSSPLDTSRSYHGDLSLGEAIGYLQTQLTAALARAEKAEEDTRRLDWLEATQQRGHYCGVFRGDTLTRAAIDAALTPTKELTP